MKHFIKIILLMTSGILSTCLLIGCTSSQPTAGTETGNPEIVAMVDLAFDCMAVDSEWMPEYYVPQALDPGRLWNPGKGLGKSASRVIEPSGDSFFVYTTDTIISQHGVTKYDTSLGHRTETYDTIVSDTVTTTAGTEVTLSIGEFVRVLSRTVSYPIVTQRQVYLLDTLFRTDTISVRDTAFISGNPDTLNGAITKIYAGIYASTSPKTFPPATYDLTINLYPNTPGRINYPDSIFSLQKNISLLNTRAIAFSERFRDADGDYDLFHTEKSPLMLVSYDMSITKDETNGFSHAKIYAGQDNYFGFRQDNVICTLAHHISNTQRSLNVNLVHDSAKPAYRSLLAGRRGSVGAEIFKIGNRTSVISDTTDYSIDYGDFLNPTDDKLTRIIRSSALSGNSSIAFIQITLSFPIDHTRTIKPDGAHIGIVATRSNGSTIILQNGNILKSGDIMGTLIDTTARIVKINRNGIVTEH